MTRRVLLALSIAAISAVIAPPGLAQTRSHGAGVNWTGGHGGVNWDGEHSYGGGSYGGYPASTALPAYRPPNSQQHLADLQKRAQVGPDHRVGAPKTLYSGAFDGHPKATRQGH